MSAEIIQFKNGSTFKEQLEQLMKLADEGLVIGIVGYALIPDHGMVCINTDHAAINNATLAYASILMSRMVGDDSDDEG